MKTQISLRSLYRVVTVASTLILANTTHAGWSLAINLPIATHTQYSTYGSTTVYGAPNSRIIATRQIPQTVCRPVWIGASTQQCITEYVDVESNYVAPAPIFIAPPVVYINSPIYITPAPALGYPGYNDHRYQHRWTPPVHQQRIPGPPPVTIYSNGSPGYGIGNGVPNYGGYNNQGNINIRLNSR